MSTTSFSIRVQGTWVCYVDRLGALAFPVYNLSHTTKATPDEFIDLRSPGKSGKSGPSRLA